MTKKNYIRTLGMIAESMFMQNPGYSWRGTRLAAISPRPASKINDRKTAVRCAAVFFCQFGR